MRQFGSCGKVSQRINTCVFWRQALDVVIQCKSAIRSDFLYPHLIQGHIWFTGSPLVRYESVGVGHAGVGGDSLGTLSVSGLCSSCGSYWTAMNRFLCAACPRKNSDHVVKIKQTEFSEIFCLSVFFGGWMSVPGQWHWPRAYPSLT